jgi:hypothetical protein
MAAAVVDAQCLVIRSSRFPAQAMLRTAERQVGNTNASHVITIHQSIHRRGRRSELLRVDDGAEGGGDLLVLEVLAEALVLQGLIPVRLLQEQLGVACVQDLLVP